MDTLALIRSARRGDIGAYNDLVLQTQDEVFTLAVRVLLNPEAAEEVARQVFIQAYKDLDQAQADIFRLWILGRAAAECWQRLQHQTDSIHKPWLKMHRISPLAAGALARRPDGIVQGNGLEAVLRMLPAEQRLALALIDLAGLDYHQAAAALSFPEETISRHLARARQALARRL
jgi:RNA polymerase sigma-70 factor (ECF subfamily)